MPVAEGGLNTTRWRVTAPSIRRAMELAGGEASGARVAFPIEPESFFAGSEAVEGVEGVSAPPVAA